MHEFPSFFDEKPQCARLLRVWIEAAELVAMQHEMSNRSLASLGSFFAPEGRKLFRQFTRIVMNGKDYEVVAFGQHEHQRASRLFESYGNKLSSEPPPKFSCPDFNRLRCVVDVACFDF